MNITVDPGAEARAAANVERLADLADAYHEHDEAHRTAVAEVSRIERAWANGDGTPTAQDHILANTEVTRCEALKKRSGQQLQALDNAAPVQTFEFASEVAHKVAELYGGTRTVISDRLPSEAPKVGTNPVLYVAQSRQAHDEGGGALAVDVDLVLYGKSRIISAPPREDIARVFTEAGWRVDVNRSDPERVADVWRSAVRLRIKRGWLPVPLVDAAGDASPRYVENRAEVGGVYMLADLLRSELAYAAERCGNRLHKFEPLSTASTVNTSEGETRERLTLGFTLKLDRAPYSPVVAQACAGLVGMLVPRLGVVEHVIDEPNPGRGHARTFVLVRREPVAGPDDNTAEDDAA